MTAHRDLKRIIRERQSNTGESYTAARAHVMRERAALQEALERFAAPEIFNTEQGSQFSGDDWLEVLKATGCRISMDGKGRWIDNVFIKRLWRSVKY